MIYGVPCDRPECTRVVALLDPFCCTGCRDGSGRHSERCDRVQRQYDAQLDREQRETHLIPR